MTKLIKTYFKRIFEVANRGDAREESYYSALSELFQACADSTNHKRVQITTLPKKTEAGNPDFRIWDGKQHITGYIEAKAPTVKNLDTIESSEQLKRYRHTFPNLILTNFFEFRLYRNGQLIDTVSIGRPFILHQLKRTPLAENEEGFSNLLERFFSFSLPRTYSAKSLAVELAKRTRFLKDQVIAEELKEEIAQKGGYILGFYEAFQKHLIFGLTPEDFADLYAQTITYGLFAARTRAENGFNRKLAFDNIPRTIGILRDVFHFISLGDLPPQMEWIVDDISEVLRIADANSILHTYYHEGKGKDPIIHFYETFLTEYAPKIREKRGVYYTPEPVVSYIVRSLNIILKEYFGKPEGFATDSVRVLDPAAGTLTFIAETTKLAMEEFTQKYGKGAKEDFIKDHILKNLYAFELMMAPYAVGHLKMSFLLEELGYKLQRDDRFKLYLTNTLEMVDLKQTDIPGISSLSKESREAGKVKKETPILVILGNPPYSGHSANTGAWISKTIKDYYQVDGKPLGEKNPKWLQDDYVKFIRFAQWKIDQAGEGLLGFITNHSYLDNPTFRGMRQSLMSSFDEIYILDLHGNKLKKEKCPDGSRDDNVFDIRQGVAIALFIKKKGLNKKIVDVSACPQAETKKGYAALKTFGLRQAERSISKIAHCDCWGLRENKYNWLLQHDIKTTEWQELHPKSEFYFFIPRNEAFEDIYNRYPKITEIFPVNSVGVVTSRDKFVIDFDLDTLKRRIQMFCNQKLPDEVIQQAFGLKDKERWELKRVREIIFKNNLADVKYLPYLYRPFDVRHIYYHDALIERPRKEVMRHMLGGGNLGLCTNRQVNGKFQHTLCARNLVNDCTVSSATRERTYLFPLYLYPDTNKKDLFSHLEEYQQKRPNLNPKLLTALNLAYKKDPSPEEIFYYIYAVFYADTYRNKYAEFLKSDFPRVPFTQDYDLFRQMGKLGKRLVDLHLLKSAELDPPIAKFQGQGKNRVEKPVYRHKRVYINQEQYFEGIENQVWEYQIGGYQVLAKWLKDRKKRNLTLDEIKHYCRIVTSIQKTIALQLEVDKIYPNIENEIVAI